MALKKLLGTILFLISISVLLSSSQYAYADVTLQWTGTVLEISDPDSLIGSKISVGDTITHIWSADPTSGTPHNSPMEFWEMATDYDNTCNYVEVNSLSWLDSVDQGVRVANDRTSVDSDFPGTNDGYFLFGTNGYTQTGGPSLDLIDLNWLLIDLTAIVFSDESLPTSLDTADFEDKILDGPPFTGNFDGVLIFHESIGFDDFDGILSFDITSISTAESCPPEKPVGGELIPLDTTSLIVAGAQMNAAWMIPVIVSAIGIGIVIARKF